MWVFKMEKLKTKCRIVFDGSARNPEEASLNDNLLPGAKRQLDIVHLLMNLRLHPYTPVGDISRMFYCINLKEEHRDYYRFLWNDNPKEEPKIFGSKTLTMGTVDSPFLAINTVHYHLQEVIKSHPELAKAATFIKEHLNVDNLIGAVDEAEEEIILRKQIPKIFDMMRMKITKWSSNSTKPLKKIPKEMSSPYEEIEVSNVKLSNFGGSTDILITIPKNIW